MIKDEGKRFLIYCKERNIDSESFRNARFVFKYPEKLEKFKKNIQEKYERELLKQKGMFI